MKFGVFLMIYLLSSVCLIIQSDGAIRISRRKLKLLKKLAVILFLGKNRKIYTVPFPLPLPLPVINKVQPIIYRQRVPYPVEVPVPVPYAEPVPYPVEVPIDDHPIDRPYDDYSDSDEDDMMETRGHQSYGGRPVNYNSNGNHNYNRYNNNYPHRRNAVAASTPSSTLTTINNNRPNSYYQQQQQQPQQYNGQYNNHQNRYNQYNQQSNQMNKRY